MGLTALNIPASVTSIGAYAFTGCGGLSSFIIPFGVTSIGAYAFQGCTGLLSFIISFSGLHIEDNAFLNCFNLGCVITDFPWQLYTVKQTCHGTCESAQLCAFPKPVTFTALTSPSH